jgi:hypothetical protein
MRRSGVNTEPYVCTKGDLTKARDRRKPERRVASRAVLLLFLRENVRTAAGSANVALE